jgi:nifR3 family TIM-barrel protein
MGNIPTGHQVKIGPLVIDPPVFLAPMAGYTDSAMRSMCLRFHCGAAVTEVVGAAGVVHGSKPTLYMLETAPDERPVAAHFYGAEPEILAQAAATAEQTGRFAFVDLNCGCPVRKVVAKGAGVALMKKPALIGKIVAAMRQAVKLPITVKTRIGISAEAGNIDEVAQAVEEAGGQAIFIHARFASKKHSGAADWETLARIKARSKIPVIGNGGILTADDAMRMMAETGVDGVMIGRAAVGHPWLFGEIHARFAGTPWTPLTKAERLAVLEDHFDRLAVLKSGEKRSRNTPESGGVEGATALKFRGHLCRYFSGLPGCHELRRRLTEIKTRADVVAAGHDAFYGIGSSAADDSAVDDELVQEEDMT